MPESFVNQAIARCSVPGSKYFFNMNPQGPQHWFKRNFIDRKEDLNLHRIHFCLEDNPSLSPEIIQRYRSSFSGIFYQRFILGKWVLSDGIIYSMFNKSRNMFRFEELPVGFFAMGGQRYIGVDYGTMNPMAFIDAYHYDDTLYVVNEYYHEGRKSAVQKTNKQYAEDFKKFIAHTATPTAKIMTRSVVIDPSAAAFKLELRMSGFICKDAVNDVLEGIQLVSTLLQLGRIKIAAHCEHMFEEFAEYSWDAKKGESGIDAPIKKSDHLMDALRYLVSTCIGVRRVQMLRDGDSGAETAGA
jgi:PBSX family phage terminase large subunit